MPAKQRPQAGRGSARPRRIPAHRTIPALIRDPLGALANIGQQSDGAITQLNLGLFSPYLVSKPAHVQHVVKDKVENYVRTGMTWDPLRPLIGHGIVGEGKVWASRRTLMQPMFTARSIAALSDRMADQVVDAVDSLGERARDGRPIDAVTEMTRVVHRVLVHVFFGGRIGPADSDQLGRAIAEAFASLGSRMLLPFVPRSVPMPGDRSFRRAVRTVDNIIYPLVRAARREATEGDIVSALCQARYENGSYIDDRHARDDIVAMFVGGTETTAVALSWLWVVLAQHPDVAEKLREEVQRVVGADRPGARHLGELRYTKMVIQELMRLYPPAWIVPRQARDHDVIDGVRINKGATILVCPFLTHRMESLWPQAEVFDPERFAPESTQRRHKYAYYPFIGGMHQCLGNHLVMAEAQLVVVAMLSRFNPAVAEAGAIRPGANITLRPRAKIAMTLPPFRAPR